MEGIGIGRAWDRAADADLRIFLGSVPDEARDLISEEDLFVETRRDLTGISGAISSQTGEGVDLLLDQISRSCGNGLPPGVASHARQCEAMQAAALMRWICRITRRLNCSPKRCAKPCIICNGWLARSMWTTILIGSSALSALANKDRFTALFTMDRHWGRHAGIGGCAVPRGWKDRRIGDDVGARPWDDVL